MSKLSIADRTAELVFDMASWETMEETVGLIDDFEELMTGRERLKNIMVCVEILAAEGARLGKGDPMPLDWLRENMKPAQLKLGGAAVRAAIRDGMRMEVNAGEDQVTDVILAEIEKKEERDA